MIAARASMPSSRTRRVEASVLNVVSARNVGEEVFFRGGAPQR